MKMYPISGATKNKTLKYLTAVKKSSNDLTFSWLLEDIYDHDYLLLPPLVLKQSVNISSGVSDEKSYSGFLKKISKDILEHKYYKDYSASQGNYNLRRFIALTENSRSSELSYDLENICITEGASGAISSAIEYIQKKFPDSEIIIPVPSYYGFKTSARHHNVKYKEVIISKAKSNSFSSLQSLLSAITTHTKAIMLTYPDNPSGLTYSVEEIELLLIAAKENDILILIDQVFLDLLFQNESSEIDVLANKLSASNHIAIVRSFSKNHNLPGLRVGYLLSKNRSLVEYMTEIQESRVLFATGSNYKGLFYMDGIFRIIDNFKKNRPECSLEDVLRFISKNNEVQIIEKISMKNIATDYVAYQDYKNELMSNYSDSFDISINSLREICDEVMPKKSGFNTFVKLKDMQDINMFDFCLNLFLSTGLKLALGPYFGLNQKDWEKNPNLGFWVRITFAVNQDSLINGIKILKHFTENYRSDPNNFIHLGRHY